MENSRAFEKLLHGMNLASDDLWIGDVDGAITTLGEAASGINLEEMVTLAKRVRKMRVSLTSQARDSGTPEHLIPQWRAARISEALEKEGIEREHAVLATLAIRYDKLRMTLEQQLELYPRTKVFKNSQYKYTIMSSPPEFEVRAILLSPARKPNTGDLKNALEKLGLTPSEPIESDQSIVIRAYSNNEYVVVMMEQYTVQVQVILRKPLGERVMEITKAILSVKRDNA